LYVTYATHQCDVAGATWAKIGDKRCSIG